jgi:peptidoglycan L-alanyl-D-glutamate endopeptidase CwlK
MERLAGVHPDLAAVVMRAIEISETDFTVIEGARTKEQQKKNVLSGASKTMKSRHIPESNQCGLSCAVDLAPMLDLDGDGDLDLSWAEKHFGPIAVAMKAAAGELGIPIQWGIDMWGWDAPHFQLPWAEYP